MKPLQENLKVHLAPRQERPVAKGPIRTGQTRLHDAGCTSDHHKRDYCDNEVSRKTPKTASHRSRGRKHHRPSISRPCEGLLGT